MTNNIFYAVNGLLLLALCLCANGEYFTAVAELEPLLETHKQVIDDLQKYINKEEQRLTHLKQNLMIYEKEQDKAAEDIQNYLSNPINAFTLFKRLTVDLHVLKENMKATEFITNVTTDRNDTKPPTLEDMTGAAKALTRLQDTYNLEVKDLSEGILKGVKYSTPMTASDCFELGRTLYNLKDYKNALHWMKEALRKFKAEEGPHNFTKNKIFEYIVYSDHFLEPQHHQDKVNKPRFENNTTDEDAKIELEIIKDIQYIEMKKTYEATCRGDFELPVAVTKRLHCRYLTENHPFLKIAPIKLEYKYRDPDIIMFHEVLSDAEIDHLKDLAKPKLKRAVVQNSDTGKPQPAAYRISKSAWLEDADSSVVARVSRRVRHMTGLDLNSAEMLQIANYGIGGHYEPHYDFFSGPITPTHVYGNRIATVLFYMSDVAQGGSTAFSRLGLNLLPEKNAAAFWYNLHPSVEGDVTTLHAACPVLRGSKWVCTKWIRTVGQEFLKPCNLEHQKEKIMRNFTKPILKTSR